MAAWTGWIALGVVLLAGAIPLGHRLVLSRRPALGSPPLRVHVVLGLAAVVLGLAHATCILPALGDPAVVGGGPWALLPGAVAAFLLVAHGGIGLRLRDPRLRKRPATRRNHAIVAATIVLAAAAHVIALRR